MITLDQYFGDYASHQDATQDKWAAADILLGKVNSLLEAAENDNVSLQINPRTGSQVGGEKNGGFRPQDCPIGAPHSSHKMARAVDIYDPFNALDLWLTDEILEAFGLFREAPEATVRWCHLSDKAPGSGKRTFNP